MTIYGHDRWVGLAGWATGQCALDPKNLFFIFDGKNTHGQI
jgi:hypothetical protein